MHITITKRVGSTVAALALAGALAATSAGAAHAVDYGTTTPQTVSVSAPASVKAKKPIAIKGVAANAVAGLPVKVTYVKASSLKKAKKVKKATKLGSTKTVAGGAYSLKGKIKKSGTYFVKVTVGKVSTLKKLVVKK
jgi:hypothetical protein